MAEFPFPITIRGALPDSEAQTVTCVGLLRELGKKRKVFDGLWRDRPVIVKLFTDAVKAKYRMSREWRGLKLLKERDLNSPTPLFYGKTEQHGWVVVTEKIDDALTVREVWDNTTDAAKRRELLCLVSRELARQHTKGVLQKDLHLGNFLLQDNELFAVDVSQMRFLSREVGKRRAVAHLALLASFAPEGDDETVTNVCEAYVRARSWKPAELDMGEVRKKLAAYRKNGIRKALAKCLRTNRRYQRFREGSYCGVAVREFVEEVDIGRLVENIDGLMEAGQILKNGNTCFVSRVSLAGKDVVVKRYNHKGIIHSARHTIKQCRARRSWLHAHRLQMLNIATPRPLAFIESCKGIIVWESYLITEYAKGRKLYDFMRDGKTGENQRSKVTGQVKELLERLGKYRITHGDLKHSNILITGDGPVLTDLDGMKVHRWNWTCKIRHLKDLKRFGEVGDAIYMDKVF
jgi:tRNA A-37 threonylcarbamoyl transferase component Bud32